MKLGIAPDVHLVNSRDVEGNAFTASLSRPVEVGIHYGALRHVRCAVAFIEGQVIPRFQVIAKKRGIPLQLAHVGKRVRVEQKLVRIESMPGRGFKGSVNAVTVGRSGLDRKSTRLNSSHV